MASITSVASVSDLRAAWQAGHDATRADLQRRMERSPGIPYGSEALVEGSFADACYGQNSMEDLALDSLSKADTSDMDAWGLTARAWAEAIGSAYAAKAWNQEHDGV